MRNMACVILLVAASIAAQQNSPSTIGGVVVNSVGAKPEAGVWVIAEMQRCQEARLRPRES